MYISATALQAGMTFDARAFERFATGAPSGVSFVCNPVDGMRRLNCEERLSLRSHGNVTAWRYMVLESDGDDISAGEWLAAIAAAITLAAIVETGGRLPHVLVRMDAPSKEGPQAAPHHDRRGPGLSFCSAT